MIVYREQRSRVRTATVLDRIAASHGFERQMELGELEAGVADALCPEYDSDLPVLRALRNGQWRGLELPEEIEISVPEGFAYYALDPELYRIAARRMVWEARPERVAVIGIRSIGTTLASIVESELHQLGIPAESWTVRPRGHPWERKAAISPELERTWREWRGHFAIVDEGPGLSGSTFTSVAAFLGSLGVPDEQIAFFPSWRSGGGSLVSKSARERWQRHAKYVADFEELGRFENDRDLSGGKWQEITGMRVPVHPQHERRKYLRGGQFYKFAGYGRYGRAILERARALAAFIPRTYGLKDGFLVSDWVSARQPSVTTEFLDHVARYLNFVRSRFAIAGGAVSLAEMIAVNTGEEWPDPEPLEEAVQLDARMMRHEWLETRDGWLKADALDHHDDHFYPGPQDIAWDIAGFSIEFGLEAEGEQYLLERFARLSGDCAAARLPFYRTAYLAFRLGYADMAGEMLRAERDRYAAILWSEPWMRNRSRLSA